MKPTSCLPLLGAALVSAGESGAETRHYALDDVFFLKEGTTSNLQPMHGYFDWTYTPGDFENGAGELLWVDIPGTTHGVEDLVVTIEVGGIEISLDGSFHDDGVDVSIKFLTDLSPAAASVIDTDPANSKFDIGGNGFYRGSIASGSVVPFEFMLRITQPSSNLVRVTWEPDYPWCILERSPTLASGSWTGTGTSSPHEEATPVAGRMFYRLGTP